MDDIFVSFWFGGLTIFRRFSLFNCEVCAELWELNTYTTGQKTKNMIPKLGAGKNGAACFTHFGFVVILITALVLFVDGTTLNNRISEVRTSLVHTSDETAGAEITTDPIYLLPPAPPIPPPIDDTQNNSNIPDILFPDFRYHSIWDKSLAVAEKIMGKNESEPFSSSVWTLPPETKMPVGVFFPFISFIKYHFWCPDGNLSTIMENPSSLQVDFTLFPDYTPVVGLQSVLEDSLSYNNSFVVETTYLFFLRRDIADAIRTDGSRAYELTQKDKQLNITITTHITASECTNGTLEGTLFDVQVEIIAYDDDILNSSSQKGLRWNELEMLNLDGNFGKYSKQMEDMLFGGYMLSYAGGLSATKCNPVNGLYWVNDGAGKCSLDYLGDSSAMVDLSFACNGHAPKMSYSYISAIYKPVLAPYNTTNYDDWNDYTHNFGNSSASSGQYRSLFTCILAVLSSCIIVFV
eukprot:Nk52_evm83s226 gene=Nk52_evmTU83s226